MAQQLSLEEIRQYVTLLWELHQQELLQFNRIHDYINGRLGYPSVPEEADQEVKDLARLAIRNVLAPVRDSFVQNLCCVGYRTATSKNNLPAWENWQRNRMDARQGEIYRPAVTYGVSYVTVTPGKNGPVFKPRSPRKMFATYEDPQVDEWPEFALETWIDKSKARPTRKGMFYDETWVYPLNLGPVLSPIEGRETVQTGMGSNVFPVQILDGDRSPIEHKAGVCPVVRYVNERDADDLIIGEIDALIGQQRAINEVNFDRLVVGRFGAFPQKVITGWTGTSTEVLKASAKRVWAFDDADVKAYTLQPASLTDYNLMLQDMMEHVALQAGISPASVTGKIVNVSADALAAAEAKQMRKLSTKRDSFGESHEQLLRVAARMAGDEATATDVEAEVQWRDTEARSFAAITDGVVKLIQALGPAVAPHLLPLLPGMTQQQLVGIEQSLQSQAVVDLVGSLRNAAAQAPGGPAGAPARQPGIPGRQPTPPPAEAPPAVA